jgi:hypothetical protein
MDAEIDGTIKVVVRSRPIFESEQKSGKSSSMIILKFSGNEITLLDPSGGNGKKFERIYREITYSFDRCFDFNATNLEVYFYK